VAVCDVDSRRADKAKSDPRIGKGKADSYNDYRKVLERDDIDVVSVVTPDHWHVKIAIEALEAGKHVFCQKPLTLTLEENQLIRNACKKHDDKVFFIGTQQRSSRDKFLRAVNMVQKGLLGDIQKVTVGINGGPKGGPFPIVDPPKELDWDFWLGQAPKVPYREKRCHYQFRWWYEYSGGKFTDWGAHHVDIASWALDQVGEGSGPIKFDGRDAKHPVPFENGYPTVDDSYNSSHDFADKCQFVGIAHRRNHRQREGEDRPPIAIEGLVGVDGLAGAVIHHDPEIAVGPRRARPAGALGHRLDPLHHGQEPVHIVPRDRALRARRGGGMRALAGLDDLDASGDKHKEKQRYPAHVGSSGRSVRALVAGSDRPASPG